MYKSSSFSTSLSELYNSRIYSIWKMMRSRCNNPNAANYKFYGGRGISVCDEWDGRGKFINFYDWAMANGYEEDLTIDRIDHEGNYEPSNCRWITNVEQQKNKRERKVKDETIKLEYNGEILTLAKWSQRTGISHYTLRQRLKKGWSVEKALTTPIDERMSRVRKDYAHNPTMPYEAI